MGKYKNNIVVLLTACVNPDGMTYTVLNDVDKRRNQYKIALDYYLSKTSIPVVFVENTMEDFSVDYQEYINQGRLECLTFEGNNYDKIRGKGYGEALIMLYAIENSRIISQSRYVLKITGRLIVKNIDKILNSKFLCIPHVFRCDFQRTDEVATVVLMAQPKDLHLMISRHVDEITECPRGYWLERVLYAALNNDRTLFFMHIIPFIETPVIEGESGTFGWNYKDEYSGNFMHNLYRMVNIYKKRREVIPYIFFKILYIFVSLGRRFKRKITKINFL